jgi:hypothetical protein
MKKHEEDAFYSISYLIAQLCLHRNETVESFSGKFSDQVLPVTEKPNLRDNAINSSTREARESTDKPNLKIARLHPSAPSSRPTDRIKENMNMIIRRRKFPQPLLAAGEELKAVQSSSAMQTSSINLPIKTYQSIFLAKSFLAKLQRGIDDLSENEYHPYHVKYKVIYRLVRLCSKMNAADSLSDSIVKCSCSKIYQYIFGTIKSEQFQFAPRQLFFIYRCPQFIIQLEHSQREGLLASLCPVMIESTVFIIRPVLSKNIGK